MFNLIYCKNTKNHHGIDDVIRNKRIILQKTIEYDN